jgi:phage portal protein BeeE
LAEKEQRVCKLEEEKSSLKNINSLLLEKMKDLSKMLMDQEEQQILNNDKVIEEIAK